MDLYQCSGQRIDFESNNLRDIEASLKTQGFVAGEEFFFRALFWVVNVCFDVVNLIRQFRKNSM